MAEKVKYQELTDQDLRNRLSEVSDELRLARQKVRIGQFKRFSEFLKMRKEIARIQTFLRAREIKAHKAA